jgi:Tol biopolymer transport system component
MARFAKSALLGGVLWVFAGCSGLNAPTSTPTATLTPVPTETLIPSETPQPSATFTATATETATLTPTITPTFTLTPTPVNTPQPTTGFTFDNWDTVSIDTNIFSLLTSPRIAFINRNNRDTDGDPRTPQPSTNNQTLYYMSPTSGATTAILDMSSSTGEQVFVSPSGEAVAYMRLEGDAAVDGLYVVDLTLDLPFRGRILPIASLVQRGIPGEPAWSPDNTRLAVTLATEYDLDIYTIRRDGTAPVNVTQNGSYDFWPSWSPDGRTLMFVSDRAICPSWIPAQVDTCDGTDTPPPTGGYVYLMDMNTQQVRQLSQQWVMEPPRWLNQRQVVYATGNPIFGDPERSLWIADTVTGSNRELQLLGNDDAFKFAEAWSPNGQLVLYQTTGSSNELVLASIDGQEIARVADLNFTRYGVIGAWSPNSANLAIGGITGQCPYGIVVVDDRFGYIARGSPPPSMCEPSYSPDGTLVAFTGVNPRIDGRVDIYVANANGFGANNMTAALRGNIDMLGWVGG